MASFISILSLFLLVLANGYFTLPVNDEQHSSSTLFPSFDSFIHETSEPPKHMGRSFPDMGLEISSTPEHRPEETASLETRLYDNDVRNETSEPPQHMRRSFEHMGLEISSTPEHRPEETASRETHMSENDIDTESSSSTIRSPIMKTRGDYDPPSASSTTVEPMSDENGAEKTRMIHHDDPFESTTSTDERSSTTISPISKRNFLTTGKNETETEDENEKSTHRMGVVERDMPVELPSTTMSSLPSTVVPELHSAPSTSTKKYPGLLRNDPEIDGETERPQKPVSRRPQLESTTPTFQTAFLDQNALNDLNLGRNNLMKLEDNSFVPVTNFPSTVRTTTENDVEDRPKPTRKPLNEGEKPSQSEEEKPNK